MIMVMPTGGGLSAEQSERMEVPLKEINGVIKDEHGYDPNGWTRDLKSWNAF
jgi:hypothetical protein